MDLEEVTNMSSNFTEDEVYTYEDNIYEKIFLELFSAVALMSMVANILIIFVILRFKKLRQDVTNIILVHLNVVEALYLLTTPLTLRVVMMFRVLSEVHMTIYCIFNENEFILGIAVCFFLVLLLCDWYLKIYWESKYVKFCNVFKFIIAAIYICVGFCSVTTTQFCVRGIITFITPLIMFVGYIVLLVFLIVLNIVHLVRKKMLRENKLNIGLFIGNSFFLLWCPAMVEILVVSVITHRSVPIALIITLCLGFTSPVFNFLYLFYYVDSFNVMFKKVFKCQCNDYENELLEEQPVSYNDVNGVEFDNKSV